MYEVWISERMVTADGIKIAEVQTFENAEALGKSLLSNLWVSITIERSGPNGEVCDEWWTRDDFGNFTKVS